MHSAIKRSSALQSFLLKRAVIRLAPPSHVATQNWRSNANFIPIMTCSRPRHFGTFDKKNDNPKEEKEDEHAKIFQEQLQKKGWLTRRFHGVLDRSTLIPDSDLRLLMAQGLVVLTYGISFTAALGTAGVDTSPLLASVGGLSIALGLALKDGVSQVLAGVQLVMQKPFRTGDIVKILAGGKEWYGKVISIDHQFIKLELKDDGVAIKSSSLGYVSIPSGKVNGTPIVVQNRCP